MHTMNITKILTMSQGLCYAGLIWGVIGCSTVKKLPDELPDVKYSDSTPAGAPQQLQGKGMQRQGQGHGSVNGKGTGKNKGTGKSKGDGSGESAKNDQAAGKNKGTGKSKGDGTGEKGNTGQGEATKDQGTGDGGDNKAENEITDFLNLDKTTPAPSHKGVNELLSLGSNSAAKLPLAENRLPDVHKTRMPAKNVGQKLILALDKSGNKINVNDKLQQKIMLTAPRRTVARFDTAPPVLKKVDNSFMPYKPGQVITLDTNLVPVKQDTSRIICLYSGASVYLSFKHDEVKMKGLYVQGKFKVRGIVKENFSGKYVPVAILEKF